MQSKRKPQPKPTTSGQTEDLRGGLVHRTTTDPYRAKKKKATAIPGGGTGKNSAYMFKGPGGYQSPKQAAQKGLAIGTQSWVNDKIAAGDIEGGMAASQSGTSIFDPVICEIAYRWFCPEGGTVLDPFAGGSVRGIVASHLGRKYVGIELRPEQVEANKAQLSICRKGDPKPDWRIGDSREIARLAGDVKADMIFSCPPYWNLEVYSDDPADLSTFGREEFFSAQASIIRDAVARLRDDRFCVWVVGDVRDRDGYYVNLPGKTISAFEAAGARLYNECILVTAVGSLPVRIRKQFENGRKLGKTHQQVLVFCKGDWKRACKALGKAEFGDIEAPADASAFGEVL